ncbi:MAG: CDF family cation-efflux transporter FieF [Pantoea sp. Brub]|nr:CDF family cation-efflux transporter FieF [Pantoea sp. Brub]
MQPYYCKLVKRSALITAIFAFFLLIVKIFAWWYTGSVSLLATLIDSTVDIATSLMNFVIIRYSLQPADSEHPFGHGKAESLAALAQSMFISGSSFLLFLTGIQYFISPNTLRTPIIGIIVTIFSLCSTLLLVIFQRWVVSKTASQAIRADMLHYQLDIIINFAILIALILSSYNFIHADATFALGIGLFIFCSALHMGYDAIQSLLDRVLPEKEKAKILNMSSTWPNVQGVHGLRTRQSGSTKFIQLHLELDDQLTLANAHQVTYNLKQALLKEFPGSDIMIHQDPSSIIYRR